MQEAEEMVTIADIGKGLNIFKHELSICGAGRNIDMTLLIYIYRKRYRSIQIYIDTSLSLYNLYINTSI